MSTAILVVVSIAAASAALLGGDRAMFVSPAPTQTLTAPAPPLAASDAAACGAYSEQRQRRPRRPCWRQKPAPAENDAPPAPEFARAPDLTAGLAAPVARAPADGALLPDYRIVTFYGHPHDPGMGIVGEYEIEQLAEMLREEAANYAAADPSRPVIPALEIIATVAQRVPGSDGTYILDTDTETLTAYIDFAAEQGMVVVLDLQVGRGTVAAEIEKVRESVGATECPSGDRSGVRGG